MRCPGCSQLLGADVSTCPVCGSPVSGELTTSISQPSDNLSASISQRQPHHSPLWKLRSRSSLWRIVLITLVVGLLVLVGVRVMLTQIAVHIAATNQARLNQAAMQLYHQVLSQPPDSQYSLTEPSSDWKLSENVDGKCSIKSDGLHVQNSITGSFLDCPEEATNFTDFAFQVDMRILSGGGGLTCRENAFGEYEFLIASDGTYSIGMQKAAQSVGFQAGTTPAMIGKTGSTNTLTLIAKGSALYFYVNQTFVTLLQDVTFSLGNVGVVANSNTGPAESVYTNAKLWKLSE